VLENVSGRLNGGGKVRRGELDADGSTGGAARHGRARGGRAALK
jgi:hypothetical protein